MSQSVGARRQFGDTPLSRAVAALYTLLVVEVMLLASTAPSLVLTTLLERDASNLPLVAVGMIPVAPAVSAALTALNAPRHLTDLHPAVTYWRGYRRNAGTVLRWWIPLLAVLTVLAVNLAHLDAAGIPGGWGPPLVVVAVLALLWGANALVISTLFSFRTRDVARLAWYFLVRTPMVTLGTLSLLVVSLTVIAMSSEAVLALAGSVLVMLLLQTCRPMIDLTRKDFTREPADRPEGPLRG